MKTKYNLLFLLLFMFTIATIHAQIKTPAASPMSKVEQDLGLGKVTIEYSRPGKKGRAIFGDLVPYGKTWRTGANASTKVEFSQDVKVGGKDLKKGKYAMYTVPNENNWEVIFYTELQHWGVPKDWNESAEAARITAKANTIPASMETMLISFDAIKNGSANLEIIWDNVYVTIPVEVDYDAEVSKQIETAMAGPSRGEYYSAASYFFKEGKDMNKALEWVKMANAKDAKFWQLKLQSEIQAKLGKKKDAIKSAMKSIELAKAAGNESYVKMNEKNIKMWK